MADQSSAADEYAILQEITAPLTMLPDDPVAIAADVDFPVVLRGYDRVAVDAYVERTRQLVSELEATRSPEAAIRRAIERVGEQISGILKRAHDTAGQMIARSRAEAEDRLEVSRQEAAQIAAAGEQRRRDLDGDSDRIWAERRRIVEDARGLAGQLIALAESATERFPPAGPEVTVELDVGAEPDAVPELLYLHLLERYGIRISAVREQVTAELATDEDLGLLGLIPPAAVMRIDEVAFDQAGVPTLLATHRASTTGYCYINEVR